MLQEYKYSFEFYIKDIRHSIASSPDIKSRIHTFDGCEWELEVKVNGSLEVYLQCLTTTRRSGRVPTAFKVSVMKQDGSVGVFKSAEEVFGVDFNPLTQGIGFGELLRKMVLLNPTAGYISNNSITVKVELTPFNAKYGDPSMNHSIWAPYNGIDKDVDLIVGGQKIAVHRFILAKGCDYFRFLLYPIQGNEITLEDCDYNATLTLIRFIYTRECVIHPNNLRNVLLIGKKFGFEWLLLSCFELLSPQNAALFSSVIDEVSDDSLEECFWKFVEKHVSTILSSDNLWTLTDDEIVSFIEEEKVKSSATAGQLQSVLQKVRSRQKKTVSQVKTLRTPETSRSSLLCVVCREDTVDTMVLPCNHLCLCSKDADTLCRKNTKKCPLCQGAIKSLTRVYLP